MSTFDFADCPTIPEGADPAQWRCEVLMSSGTIKFGHHTGRVEELHTDLTAVGARHDSRRARWRGEGRRVQAVTTTSIPLARNRSTASLSAAVSVTSVHGSGKVAHAWNGRWLSFAAWAST